MTLKQFDLAFSELLSKTKGISLCTDDVGFTEFTVFRESYQQLLEQLNDVDLAIVALRFARLRYFNLTIQAQRVALNQVRESRRYLLN